MPAPSKKLAVERREEQPLQDGPLMEMVADHLRLRFCRAVGLGWLEWNGMIWNEVVDDVVVEAVRIVLRDFMAEEIMTGASAARVKQLETVLGSGKIRSVVGLLRGALSVNADQFDIEYDLLNVSNGVVDLRTGELLPHDPNHRFTKITRVAYEPGARSKYWTIALRALPVQVRSWMQVRLGQALSGHPPTDDLLPVSKGAGANGKSTFFDTIRFSLGTFSALISDRVLLANPGDHPTELTDLRGLRLAILEELPEGGRFNIKRLKDVLGTESITARKIRENNMTWRVTHSLFVTTNYTPRVSETDHGTWRRLALVRFPYTYRKPGEALKSKLDREGDPTLRQRTRYLSMQKAALAWMVEGAKAWYDAERTMPPVPDAVARATEEWRAQADHVFSFSSEFLEWEPTRSVLSSDLVTRFNEWLSRNGKPEWANELIIERFGNHHLIGDHSVSKDRLRVKAGQISRPARGDGPHVRRLDDGVPVVGKQLAQWFGVAWREEAEEVE